MASHLSRSLPRGAVSSTEELVPLQPRLGKVASPVPFDLAALPDCADSPIVIRAACVSAALHDLLHPCTFAADGGGSGQHSSGVVERCADRICSITLGAVRTLRLCARF